MFGPVLTRPALGVLAAALVGLGLTACDTDDGRQLREPTPEQRAAMPTTTSSTTSLPGEPAVDAGPVTEVPPTLAPGTVVADFTLTGPWMDGGPIDPRYTCDGENLAPLIAWTTPPAGAVELALVVSDPDAEEFVHYAVAGIPATPGQIGAGVELPGSFDGLNDFGERGWSGPCPPAGETHTYRWTLYALAQPTQLAQGFSPADLLDLAFEHGFASAELTGTYFRAG